MKNARLRGFKIDVSGFSEKVDIYICQNFLKTQYFIVIPRLNWGYKLLVETEYDEMKSNMIESLRIYNFLPSDSEQLVMDIFYILFSNKFEDKNEESNIK